MKDALHQVEWDDEGEADEAALVLEEPQHHESEPQKEVALDDKVYTFKDEGKKLKQACAERSLPTRLHNFKLRLQWEIEVGIAKKLYEEEKRKPVAIKDANMPSKEVQDHHNLTRIPFKSWCEASLATLTKRTPRTFFQAKGHFGPLSSEAES